MSVVVASQPSTSAGMSANATSSGQTQPSVPTNYFTSTYVTPALSAQVAHASKSNPILANLLNAVINRTATDDQVKTLGLLIKSMEGIQHLESPDPAPTTTLRAGSPKPFDIVLEFQERPADRWILPRGDVVCERVGVAEGTFCRSADVILTTSLTPPNATGSDPTASSEPPPSVATAEVVSFRLSRVPQHLWELLVTWAGGTAKMDDSRLKLAQLVRLTSPDKYDVTDALSRSSRQRLDPI